MAVSSPVWRADLANTDYQYYLSLRVRIADGEISALADGDYLLMVIHELPAYSGASSDLVAPGGWSLVSRFAGSFTGGSDMITSYYGHVVSLPEPEYVEWTWLTSSGVIAIGIGYRGVRAVDPVERITTAYGEGYEWETPAAVVSSNGARAIYAFYAGTLVDTSALVGWTQRVHVSSMYVNAKILDIPSDVATLGPYTVSKWSQYGHINAMIVLASGAPPEPATRHKRGAMALL